MFGHKYLTMTAHGVNLSALAIGVWMLAACGGGAGAPAPASAKSYSGTTCTDWSGAMQVHERFVAAADMLTGARSQDGGKTVPGLADRDVPGRN
jgi:hypothetical protein